MYAQTPMPCADCAAPIASPYRVRKRIVCGDCATHASRQHPEKP